MDQSDVRLGRFISLVLRHQPSAANITLDEHGWADVDELLIGICNTGRMIDMETLERIVRENDKQRYIFNEDHAKIRANQGHSLKVNMEFKPIIPPAVLYHGTATRFLDSIRNQGIRKMNRQYVHLSADHKTAVKVGGRHGVPVVLRIDAAKMSEAGMVFYCAENGVWLTDFVPWEYVTELSQPE